MNASTRILVLCILTAVTCGALAVSAGIRRNVVPDSADSQGRVTLPNGWRVTPAGKAIALPGDMPLGMVLSADGKYLLVNTAGYHHQGVCAIDLATDSVAQSVDLHKDWLGLALSPSGTDLYVAGGSYSDQAYQNGLKKEGVPDATAQALARPVYRLTFADGRLEIADGVAIPGMGVHRYTAGLACGKDGSLYVADINNDTIYRLSGANREIAASVKVGYRPYALALSPKGDELAVANWGDQSVSLLDSATLDEKQRVAVGSHPNALLYGRDGRLYVACGGENKVAVVRGGSVVEAINTSLEANSPIGTTPDALAMTPDGKTLFVACADVNAVAIVDVGKDTGCSVRGFIPTGWYPSALAVAPDGKKLYIGTGKGLAFRANFPGRGPALETSDDGRTKYDYIGNVLSGAVSVVEIPDSQQRAEYTRAVRANMPQAPRSVVSGGQISDAAAAFRRIKHVVYIIRENRTYDQVFGDISGANGDPSITMYGESITPNAHSLARKTVVLDNLYCSGEVSEDGHQWCNAAYVTDFKERAWITSYSGRGEPDDDGRLSDSPAGYLWDNCAKHGVTYRTYGEFAHFTSSPTSAPVFHGPASLKGHTSEAWSATWNKPDSRDTNRADAFIDELHQAERSGEWPRFMVMSLGEDHTSGLSAGAFTPFACVASNDLALGKMVEAISKSRFWPETAIFVIEDDAQDGPDHVDAHRTAGLVISPYVKRGVVDSTLYTTTSMVRTMEMILGLPPMTVYDRHAMPLYNCFTSKPDLATIAALPARVDVMARNPKAGEGARQSAKLDFHGFDRADPGVLNRILWADARPGVPMPPIVHSGVLVR